MARTNTESSSAWGEVRRYEGNLAPMPGVFPDYRAQVIRDVGDGERKMVMMRWGMPPPPRTGGPPLTNIRNTSSPHWRAWVKPEHHCLVPVISLAEYAPEPNLETKKKDVVWFCTCGIAAAVCFCRNLDHLTGDHGTKSKPVPGPHQVYEFLTTTPNTVVEPIHPKVMRVILTTAERTFGCEHRGTKRTRNNARCQVSGPGDDGANRHRPLFLTLLHATVGKHGYARYEPSPFDPEPE